MAEEKETKKVAATAEVKDAKETAAPKKTARKKPRKRIVPEGRAYIQASFNNTVVSITDPEGQVLSQSSAGANGFKGPKKATPYAAQIAAEKAVEKAKVYGIERVRVFIKGAGNGREQAIRGLHTGGLSIETITDITAVPHNGCRPRKSRRV
jgi:small subunit ribosomal protein S11